MFSLRILRDLSESPVLPAAGMKVVGQEPKQKVLDNPEQEVGKNRKVEKRI